MNLLWLIALHATVLAPIASGAAATAGLPAGYRGCPGSEALARKSVRLGWAAEPSTVAQQGALRERLGLPMPAPGPSQILWFYSGFHIAA